MNDNLIEKYIEEFNKFKLLIKNPSFIDWFDCKIYNTDDQTIAFDFIDDTVFFNINNFENVILKKNTKTNFDTIKIKDNEGRYHRFCLVEKNNYVINGSNIEDLYEQINKKDIIAYRNNSKGQYLGYISKENKINFYYGNLNEFEILNIKRGELVNKDNEPVKFYNNKTLEFLNNFRSLRNSFNKNKNKNKLG